MQGEITMVAERLEHGLRDRAHADLHDGAVGNERRHVSADRALDLADRRRRIHAQRLVDVHPHVDLGLVEGPVAARARHLRIDLRDHERHPARGIEDDARRHAEAQITAGIGRRRVHDHAIRRPRAARRERRDQIEVADRDELDASTPARIVQAWRHMPRRHPQRVVLGSCERIGAEMDPVDEREIGKPGGLPAHLGDERGWLATAGWQQYAHARREARDSAGERRPREGASHSMPYRLPRCRRPRRLPSRHRAPRARTAAPPRAHRRAPRCSPRPSP